LQETNRYAEQYIQSVVLEPRFRVRNWKPITWEEIYMMSGLFMLMGIIQKSYFYKGAFLETPIFGQTMTLGRMELVTKFPTFC
jgi:hypothetical protein